jgi:type II secretory pathway predicted ATPase ExeA
MVEAFFGFKKAPFSDSPDAKQLFASQAWNQVKARLQFLVDHHGAGLLTGEVGAGKSTAARTFSAGLNPNLYKILYLHWTSGSALDLLRQIALELGIEPATIAATWCARSPKPSCISTAARSSIPS